MLLRLARYYEWVFGSVLMVTLGVIVLLPILSGYSQWVLVIGLLLYLVATLARVFDDVRRLHRSL